MKHTEENKIMLVKKAREGESLENLAKLLNISQRSVLTYLGRWARQNKKYNGDYVLRLKQEFYRKGPWDEKDRREIIETIPDLIAIILFNKEKTSLQETSNLFESVFGFRFHLKFLESQIQEEIGEIVTRDNGHYCLKTEGNQEYREWLEDYRMFLLSESRFHHYKFNYIANRKILNKLLDYFSS